MQKIFRRIPAAAWGLLLLAAACAPYSPSDLAGSWDCVSLKETGDSLPVDVTAIHFTFEDGGRYAFQSTLKYREEGAFKIRESYLYTLDELATDAREKAVEITRLSRDTLILRMREQGKERIMVLARAAQE